MRMKKNEGQIILYGNELFLMIGIVAAAFFCLGIYLLITCIWPEDGVVDWLGTCFVGGWTCMGLFMAVRSLNEAFTELVIDAKGVQLRRPLGKRYIPWNEIGEWGLSYEGIANHDDDAYEFYFAPEPQPEKNESSRKLRKEVLRCTVIGEEYRQVVLEVLPFCQRYARVKPFVPEDAEYLM